MCVMTLSLHAEWNIEKPSKDVPKNLTGSIFGRDFTLGKAEWSKHALTIESKDKVAGWAASELIIFIDDKDGKTEWEITPDNADFGSPHIHMKFGKEGRKFPGTLMFTREYCMYLKLVEKKDGKASFQIHVSLPDYKKFYLFGTFEAKVTK